MTPSPSRARPIPTAALILATALLTACAGPTIEAPIGTTPEENKAAVQAAVEELAARIGPTHEVDWERDTAACGPSDVGESYFLIILVPTDSTTLPDLEAQLRRELAKDPAWVYREDGMADALGDGFDLYNNDMYISMMFNSDDNPTEAPRSSYGPEPLDTGHVEIRADGLCFPAS